MAAGVGKLAHPANTAPLGVLRKGRPRLKAISSQDLRLGCEYRWAWQAPVDDLRRAAPLGQSIRASLAVSWLRPDNRLPVTAGDQIEPLTRGRRMIFNWFEWGRDGRDIPKIHPTQKPVVLLKRLISVFTDPCDVVIDPCAGSGSTLRACMETGRRGYGFEISRDFYRRAQAEMLTLPDENQITLFEGGTT